jgi:hypothetical protein
MKRREFVTLLGGAAAWPLSVHAQQPTAMRRIGLLMTGVPTEPTLRSYVAAFEQTLRTMGWVDGQNVRIDYRWNAGNAEQAQVKRKGACRSVAGSDHGCVDDKSKSPASNQFSNSDCVRSGV